MVQPLKIEFEAHVRLRLAGAVASVRVVRSFQQASGDPVLLEACHHGTYLPFER